MHQRSAVRAALRGKRLAIAVAAAFVPLGEAYSLPTGEQVVHGQVNVTRPDAVTMQINQGTQKGIVNWTGFSINGNEHVNITQPNSAASLLNRVVGNDPSNIFGRLTANGQVFLVNNAGVFFAPGASVNAAAIVASTLSITDQSFLDNTYQFFNPGNAGSVVNQGSIVTAGGFTALIGPQVRNDGIILANSGKIALGAGNRVSLDMIGDGLVSISVDEAAFSASVINTGTLQADGGTVMLKASSANALLDTVINTSGIVRANSLIAVNGEIILDGGGRGTVAVTGTVEGTSATVSGAAITVSDGGTISTSAGSGSQTISTPGTLAVLGGTAGNTAISHAGTGQQHVTAGNIAVRGGGAVGGTSATIGSSNAAADQTITVAAGNIEVTGGTFGSGNRAAISSAGNQTIAGNADITLTGGASGDSNIAVINAGVAKTQTIHARNISLTSGSGGTNNGAAVLGQTQFITTTEDVRLSGNTSGGTLAGVRVGGLSVAAAGVDTPTDLTLNAGRDVLLTGGSVPNNMAIIGSSGGQPQALRITAGRDVALASLTLNSTARIGASLLVPGTISVTAGRDVRVSGHGEIVVNGTLDLHAAGALSLDATSPAAGNAFIGSNGGQTITARSISLTAQNNRLANIENTNGNQTITATAGDINLQVPGGFGVAQIINTAPGGDQTVTASGQLNVLGGSGLVSTNSGIFKNGEGGTQTVSAAGITLQGASSRTNAGAVIVSRGKQLVDATGGNINLIGGSGGIANNVLISTLQATPTSPIEKQTIRAHHITLTNSSGGTDTVAGIFGGKQEITATGNVTLTSGGALVGGAAGGPGVRIGAPGGTTSSTDLTLNVGGNLVLNGGTAIENGAAIGSSGAGAPQQNKIFIDAGGSVILNAGTEPNTGVRIGSGSSGTAGGNITILADGNIELNGTQRSAAIRTLGNVTLEAASISQGTNGFILADTLATTTSGITNLAGPNEIARFNATSGGALTLVDGGALQVTGITTTNDAITLTTGSLTNTGTITNTGGAPGVANVILNADAFNLAGGTIDAGAAAVVLRPRTGTNSFGIEAAGQTTLTNADIASIHTSDFVVFGSSTGTIFTGNMTIGQNARVEGNGKGLAFSRSLTPSAEMIIIGSQGVATTGDVILGAGGGGIRSNGGTITGDEVQLRASNGIGTPSARVNTAANALAINNAGGGGVFVSELDNVTLRTISLNVGGTFNTASNTNNGTLELTVGGTLNVAAAGPFDAVVSSVGGQSVTAQSVNVTARDGRTAQLLNTAFGEQRVTAGSIDVETSMGGGLAEIRNNSAGAQRLTITGDHLSIKGLGGGSAAVFGGGNQTIDMVTGNRITLGDHAAQGQSVLSSNGDQTIQGNADLTLIGGSGPIANGSNALISANNAARTQTINARTLTMENSNIGGNSSVAGILGANQVITTTGDVVMTANASGGALPGVRIGGLGGGAAPATGTNLTLNVGRDLKMTGGTVAGNGVGIGSTAAQIAAPANNITINALNGNVILETRAAGAGVRIGSSITNIGTGQGNITINAGGDIRLNGVVESTSIRTLGTVTLNAANISEAALGTIVADTLNTSSTGSTVLAGMDPVSFLITNQVSNFNGKSGGDLRFFNRGPLTVTHLDATGDASLVNALGNVNLVGQWTSSTASIFSGAAIMESGAGAIQTASLTAEAPLGLNLAGANRVGVLDARTSDVLTFNNVAPLEVARASASNGVSLTSAGTMTISGQIISSSGISLTANGGSIVETGTGSITAAFGGLSTFSSGDTTLNSFANQVSSFNATSGGDVSLVNNGFLNVSGMNAAGDAAVTAFGNTTVSGPWTAGGTSAITAGDIVLSGTLTSADVVLNAGFGLIGSGSIGEVGGGAVIANTLSTTAGGTTSLGGPNVVSNYNGASGGDLTLNNIVALNVTGLEAGGHASLTNFGNVTLSGAWSSPSASITANGFGSSITETGAGAIHTGSLTTLSEGATSLTGANQVQTFNGSTSFGGTGGITLHNTGPLNVTVLATGGNARLVNEGAVDVTGAWFSSGSTDIATVGGNLTVANSLTSGTAMTLDIGGTLTVSANGPQTAQLNANSGGQTITAQSVDVLAQNGGFAQISNFGSGDQRITIHGGGTGAGLDVRTLASGGFARIDQNVSGFAQRIEVFEAEHVRVNGAGPSPLPNGGAAIFSQGAQTVSISGSGSNAIEVGSLGARGASNIGTLSSQNVTAGLAGQQGSIVIVGSDTPGASANISAGSSVGATQTVSTSGMISITGGRAPAGAFSPGIFHNGSGQQTVNAAGIVLTGGTSGNNNSALISVTGAGNPSNAGAQVVNVSGDITIIGGAGGNAGIQGSASRQQTVHAHNITVMNSAAGGNNSVGFIQGGLQDIYATGNVTLTARASGGGVGGPGVRIGGLGGNQQTGFPGTATDLDLFVGGNLVLNGGTAVNNGVGIGSTSAGAGLPNRIFIDAGGNVELNAGTLAGTGARIGSAVTTATTPGEIEVRAGAIALNGTAQPTTIRTLGNVTLRAASISEASNGFVVADTLTATSTGGDTSLTGPNQVSNFSGTSSADLSLANTGALNVTGVSAGGDATLNNVGNVTVSGPWTAGGTSSITAASDIVLAAILTSPNVVLNAGGGSISEIGAGAIVASTLSTTAGSTTSLTGLNQVASYNGVSGGNLTLNNGVALDITGLNAGGHAAITNFGNVNVSGAWSSGSASISATGFGSTISEAGAGAIETASLTTFSEGATSLTGANQVQTFNASTGFGGDLSLNNTGALNLTGMNAGGNVTLTNTGAVDVTGLSFAFGSIDITTTGGNLTLTNSLSSAAAMTLDIDGTLTVSANGPQTAQLITNNGGQTIRAQSVEVVAQNGGFATIVNSGVGEQRITINGGGTGAGLDVHTLASGGFAQIGQQATGFAQTIEVTDADHINVNGAGGGAAIFGFGGTQTLSITGSDANAITLGRAGSLGPSQVFGGVQNVTAGTGGESGSITIVGGNGNATFTGISSGQIIGGTQTVSTSGTLRIVGGDAPNQPPSGFATGLFHNGSGQQTVNAANLEMQGGSSGLNNLVIVISSGGGGTIAAGNQVVNVAGSLELAGGSGGGNNTAIIVSFADQTVNAGAVELTGGSGGANNGAFINIAGAGPAGNQSLNITGDLGVAGGAGGNAGITGSANLQQTIFADNITLTNSAGGGINSVGFILGGRQDIHAAGNVTLTARASGGDLPGVRIGGLAGAAPTATDLTLNVGGDLVLSGGTAVNNGVGIGSTAATGVPPLENNITINAGGSVILNSGTLAGTGARIGSPATATGPGSINITAGGGIELNGVSQGTAIRTLGTVTLAADHITEAANGFIVAGTLNTTTQGDQILTGPNRVALFTASSETGNVSLTNTAPVLTLGSMDLPGSLTIDQTGTLSIPGTVSALSHVVDATGDVLVGSAGATDAALLYASGDISIEAGGSVIVRGSDLTPMAASAVLAGGDLHVAAGNVSIIGGGALLAPAAMRGEAVDINAASELRVKGGSGHLSPALLSSGSNINLTIGDAVRVDAGSGFLSLGRIQTEIRDGVIHIAFPDLSQGGYFVNGVEGRTHQGQTGFFTLNKPAKVGKTLVLDYGGAE